MARCSEPFAAYAFEKKLSKTPQMFGKGAIARTVNQCRVGQQCWRTDFLHPPAYTWHPTQCCDGADGRRDDDPRHHPWSTCHDLNTPKLYWGMIASMWIGNLLLLVINLPMIGIWVRLLKIPYQMMFPAILMFCCIGDLLNKCRGGTGAPHRPFWPRWLRADKFGFEPAPMLLGFVLGKLIKGKLRRALLISRGDLGTLRLEFPNLGGAAWHRSASSRAGDAAQLPQEPRRGLCRIGAASTLERHPISHGDQSAQVS